VQATSRVNRRARVKQAKGSVTKEEIKGLIDNNQNCYWCKCMVNNSNRHLDHYIPLGKGGDNTIDNMVISCVSCNLSKGALMPGEWVNTMENRA